MTCKMYNNLYFFLMQDKNKGLNKYIMQYYSDTPTITKINSFKSTVFKMKININLCFTEIRINPNHAKINITMFP